MTNKKFWFRILILTLVFGMTVIGCEDEPEEDVGREESVSLPASSGEFTFTDIPAKYNGKYAIAEGYIQGDSSKGMIGFKGAKKNTSNPNVFSTIIAVKIENGSVNIPLYTFSPSSPVSTIQVYSGNDSMYVDILILNSETYSAGSVYIAAAIFGTDDGKQPLTYPVKFTAGKATKSNNEADIKLVN